jgi:predicted transposase YbfD/YdcC
MVAIDGKCVRLDVWDNHYAQRHRDAEHLNAVGLARTMTCALVSARAKVCIEAVPVPADTNEVGHFRAVLESLANAYGSLDLFRLVSGDAGTCSEENADDVVAHGWHYLFAIKNSQPQIRAQMERLLGKGTKEQALAETVDVLDNETTVTRRLYLVEKRPLYRWSHARTFLRVESEKVRGGNLIEREDRYFISSLPRAELRDEQWLHAVRLHWAVENGCHCTWDVAFAEDARPWIRAHPRAAVVLMLLRRIAYNIVALFRSVTQRSDERRQTPWKDILRAFRNTFIVLATADLDGLRQRAADAR